MQALRTLLESIDQKPDSVKAVLQQLPAEDFALDVHVCSYGGVGSTELSNFLNRHGLSTNLLTDEDNLRHIKLPPKYGAEGPRTVIYLYGDPLASIASHYRRGHALHQAIKTSGNPTLKEATFPASFDAYAANGEDLFGYVDHFHNWLRQPTSSYSVVLLRYERMFEIDVAKKLMRLVAGHVRSTAELDAMAEEFCALQRLRSSSVPPSTRMHIYDSMCCQMNSLPPLVVRDAQGEIRMED